MFLLPIPMIMASLAAVLTPILIIAIRHNIRLTRIRIIYAFNETFQWERPAAAAAQVENADNEAARSDLHKNTDPSFEYVKSKYVIDINYFGDSNRKSKRRPIRDFNLDDHDLEEYIFNLKWYELSSNWELFFVAVPYMLICFYGFLLAFYPIAAPATSTHIQLNQLIAPLLLMVGGGSNLASNDIDLMTQQTVTLMAITFLASYFFSIRLFLRAVNVFDLTSVTILRATTHILISAIGIVVLFRTMPHIPHWEPACANVGVMCEVKAEAGLSNVWFAIAFVFGLAPDMLTTFLVKYAMKHLPLLAIKTTDDRFISHTQSISLDVIDGVDFFTRFRLEEAGVLEVQNLACANPIMLFIETPFPFFQLIDWVAQAQLCTVVGLERYMMFRQHNIRTIFDLQRAVLSAESTPQLRRIVMGILAMTTQTARRIETEILGRKDTGKPLFVGLSDPGGGSASPPPMKRLTLEEYEEQVARLLAEPTKGEDDATIKHYVRVLMDDLHVHRLRLIWNRVADKLGKNSDELAEDQ